MIFLFVMLLTFLVMEGITWLTHKYVMHGFLWVLHEDHHQPTGHILEKNDAFFLIFAIPSMLCIFFGTFKNIPWLAGLGAGVAMYGFAYFVVHEVIIHQRIKWFTRSNIRYIKVLRWAHKMHHKHLEKHESESFGMLFVAKKYWDKVKRDEAIQNNGKLFMSHANPSLPTAPSYDYIIAGAGGAGLSLLHYLLASPVLSNKQILVIDHSLHKTNDRTWCFWEMGDHEFESLVQHRWDAISIHAGSFSKELATAPFSYKMIQGIDFYNYVITAAKLKPNVHWVEAAISSMAETVSDNTDKEVLVKWEGGFAQGKKVFTSILPFQMNNLASVTKYDSINQPANKFPFLWQHFKGRVVSFNQPVFDQQVARLMDFNVPQHSATAFMYLLPINEMQALVEYTLFSDQILEIPMYDLALNDYLAKHYPDSVYTIEHEEIGAIPMTHQSFSNFEAPIYAIGALGMAIKASTGYAFQFIQQQSKNIVIQLEQGLAIQTNIHNTRHRFYDAVLLHVLFYHKMEGAEIFKRIFAKNEAATVFKFLSNTSNLWEDIQIMRSLPTRIFLPAAIAVLRRRA